MKSCPSVDHLRALSLGRLAKTDREVLFAHVEACASCSAWLVASAVERTGIASEATDVARDDEPSFEPGALVAGRYRIVDLVARGGQGEVFEAVDVESGDAVALKVFFESASAKMRAFERELRAGRRVDHPNVVRILDWTRALGRDVLVTEFVAGVSLDAAIATRSLDASRIESIAYALVDGLAALHEAGVLHRDLKPQNVVIRAGGAEPVIVDLGLARELSSETTKTHAHIGTPVYWPPEIAAGQPWTGASDVYALGRTVLAMLESVGESRRDARLVAFVEHCLQPFAERRPVDARAARTWLRSSVRRRWVPWAAAGVFALGLAAFLVSAFPRAPETAKPQGTAAGRATTSRVETNASPGVAHVAEPVSPSDAAVVEIARPPSRPSARPLKSVKRLPSPSPSPAESSAGDTTVRSPARRSFIAE